MSEQHDWLFGMVNNLVGQVRLIVEYQRDVVFAGDIFDGDDREFIPRNEVSTTCRSRWLVWAMASTGSGLRLFERNILDAPARGRAAHGHAVQHAVKLQIVDVERRTGNFLAAFFAGNGFADGGHYS